MKTLSLIITLLIGMNLSGQNHGEIMECGKAIGYAYGIELTLNHIIESNTRYSRIAKVKQIEFNQAHGQSINEIEQIVQEHYKLTSSEIKMKIRDDLENELSFEMMSDFDIDNYLDNFLTSHIMGLDKYTCDFVGILNKYNNRFNKNPLLEFLNNYRKTIGTLDHPKAKGLDLSFEYPLSWTAQEAKRPNVVTLIKDNKNLCSITLAIKDIVPSIEEEFGKFSEEEVEYIRSEEFALELFDGEFDYKFGKEFISEIGLINVNDYSFEKTLIEGEPCIVVKGRGVMKRATISLNIYCLNYLIIYKGRYIIMSLMLNGETQSDIIKHYKIYEPLANSIVNSLVINDKWR